MKLLKQKYFLFGMIAAILCINPAQAARKIFSGSFGDGGNRVSLTIKYHQTVPNSHAPAFLQVQGKNLNPNVFPVYGIWKVGKIIVDERDDGGYNLVSLQGNVEVYKNEAAKQSNQNVESTVWQLTLFNDTNKGTLLVRTLYNNEPLASNIANVSILSPEQVNLLEKSYKNYNRLEKLYEVGKFPYTPPIAAKGSIKPQNTDSTKPIADKGDIELKEINKQ